jgi:polyisoprenoid-binding protein YceI
VISMPRYTQDDAEALVFTFKDGLLSKVAHDLELRVTRFSVDIDAATSSVSAELDPASLVVVNAMHDGKAAPRALSDADKQKIESQIRKEVLETDRHELIRFRSSQLERRADGGYSVTGELTLHGATRPLRIETRLEGGRHVAEIELHQPDYGIVPFKAMMGTLKVKADVRLRLSLPS